MNGIVKILVPMFCLFAIGCKTNIKNNPGKIIYSTISQDYTDENIFERFSQQLSLSALNDGVDSFAFRLWVFQSPFIPRYLVNINYDNSIRRLKWHFYYLKTRVTNEDSFALVKDVNKKFDWISFDSVEIRRPIVIEIPIDGMQNYLPHHLRQTMKVAD